MTKTLLPRDEADLADMVRHQVAHNQAFEIKGGGSRAGFGHPVVADTVISTENLNGIELYEPGALTIVAKAGTPLADIEAALAAEGQHLPFEPVPYNQLLGTDGQSTIGGVVACGISGPRRIQTGACRDSLIGVRFVNGEGQAVKNGGRVMKNVTGYDLVKLLCGSHGTLGALSEVSFKLLPKPETSSTLTIECDNIGAAVKALTHATNSPFDISGAAAKPSSNTGWTSYIRIEGFENSVNYRTAQLKEQLAQYGLVEVSPNAGNSTWAEIGTVSSMTDNTGAIWRISVAPNDSPKIWDALQPLAPSDILLDWAGGLIWLAVNQTDDCGSKLVRQTVDKLGGHATLIRASEEVKKSVPVFHPEPSGIAALSQAIKNKFDPNNVFNPGRMGLL